MPWTNASIVLNGRDRANANAGNYNNANFNTTGQNIIQGQIHSISLNEVNFPYDIPNVQEKVTDLFYLISQQTTPPVNTVISFFPGFYTGAELETAINAGINQVSVATGIALIQFPVCVYDATSNRFEFTLNTSTIPNLEWEFASPYTFPLGAAQTNTLGKDIMSLMGFSTTQDPLLTAANSPFEATGSAPLAFTQYIDICSPQLCKGQRFRDGSTTNLARRSDVICRLYISNNVATQEEEGMRPFVINRQFNNARVMKWTTDNSVGTIDIQLYDDVGQPLQTTWQPRPYQITFNCYEQNTDGDDRMLSDHLKSLIGGAASYL